MLVLIFYWFYKFSPHLDLFVFLLLTSFFLGPKSYISSINSILNILANFVIKMINFPKKNISPPGGQVVSKKEVGQGFSYHVSPQLVYCKY